MILLCASVAYTAEDPYRDNRDDAVDSPIADRDVDEPSAQYVAFQEEEPEEEPEPDPADEEEPPEEPDDPPTITQFDAEYDPLNDVWTFSGWVDDEDPDTCTVYFGGLLDGHEADVEADGYFEYSVDLEGEVGAVTVVAEDEDGDQSEEDGEVIDEY